MKIKIKLTVVIIFLMNSLIFCQVPEISFVSKILPVQNQNIIITGSGFGSHIPYNNKDDPHILFHDITANWKAGNQPSTKKLKLSIGRIFSNKSLFYKTRTNGNAITLNISEWTKSRIVISGFAGRYGKGTWKLNDSDKVVISIWNMQNGKGPANYTKFVHFETVPSIARLNNNNIPNSNSNTSTTSTATTTSTSNSVISSPQVNKANLSKSKTMANMKTSKIGITSVKFLGNIGKDLKIVINGYGFGSSPVSMPFNGLLKFHFGDNKQNGFEAGHYGDAVSLRFQSWKNNKIIIEGFTGSYGLGSWYVSPGDPVNIIIYNMHTNKQVEWKGILPSNTLATSPSSGILSTTNEKKRPLSPNTPAVSNSQTQENNPTKVNGTNKNQTILITVPANIRWYDTGISVAPGDLVEISASGEIYVGGSSPYQTPSGTPKATTEGMNTQFLAPKFAAWSLIGRVGSNTPFEVGKRSTMLISQRGNLFLSVNDNFFGDNSGEWKISIIFIIKSNNTSKEITSNQGQQNTAMSNTQQIQSPASQISTNPTNKKTEKGIIKSFNLPLNILWYDTQIGLSAGETISIFANGMAYMSLGSKSPVTPLGVPNATGAGSGFAAPGLSPYSLVGKIGKLGVPFEVGTNYTITSSINGELYLSINDDYFPDNSGNWEITITHKENALSSKSNKSIIHYIVIAVLIILLAIFGIIIFKFLIPKENKEKL